MPRSRNRRGQGPSQGRGRGRGRGLGQRGASTGQGRGGRQQSPAASDTPAPPRGQSSRGGRARWQYKVGSDRSSPSPPPPEPEDSLGIHSSPTRPLSPTFSQPSAVRSTRTKGARSRYLNAVKHHQDDKSYRCEEVKLYDLPFWFDEKPHDYTFEEASWCSKVSPWWQDPAGFNPEDLRTRRMRLKIGPEVREFDAPRIVVRTRYRCNDSCMRLPPAVPRRSERMRALRRQDFRVPDSAIEDEVIDTQTTGGTDTASRKRTRQCQAEVVVEITVEQAKRDVCSVWSKRNHKVPAPGVEARLSPFLRNRLHHDAAGSECTPSRLEISFFNQYMRTDPYALRLSECSSLRRGRIPSHGDDVFRNAITVSRKRWRLHSDALAAVKVMSDRNPSMFVHFNVPDSFEDPAARMEACIAPPSALEHTMLFAYKNGLMMDTAWRNKNGEHLPLTFIVTVADNDRMVPLLAMISVNHDEEAYSTALATLYDAVCDHAQRLVDGKVRPVIDQSYRVELLQQARSIARNGLKPSHIMIDHAEAERAAAEMIMPDVPIRVCQYHMMNAIRSKLTEWFGTSDESFQQINGVLEAVRRCQRCPRALDWDDYLAALAESVEEIATDLPNSEVIWPEFRRYLFRTWLSDTWRPYACDYGLPPLRTREGSMNTNNYCESAFRAFDRVFLQCKSNKRLDRLVHILAEDFFTYYAEQPLSAHRPNPKLVRALIGGRQIWEDGAVEPIRTTELPAPWANTFREAFKVKARTTNSILYCGVRRDSPRLFCTCIGFDQTGMACSHLRARQFWLNSGDVTGYNEAIFNTEIGMPRRSRSSRTSDANDDEGITETEAARRAEQEFRRVWREPPGDLNQWNFNLDEPGLPVEDEDNSNEAASPQRLGPPLVEIVETASGKDPPSPMSDVVMISPPPSPPPLPAEVRRKAPMPVRGRPPNMKPLDPRRAAAERKSRISKRAAECAAAEAADLPVSGTQRSQALQKPPRQDPPDTRFEIHKVIHPPKQKPEGERYRFKTEQETAQAVPSATRTQSNAVRESLFSANETEPFDEGQVDDNEQHDLIQDRTPATQTFTPRTSDALEPPQQQDGCVAAAEEKTMTQIAQESSQLVAISQQRFYRMQNKPIPDGWKAGLKSFSNSCYILSTVQALYRTSSFRYHFYASRSAENSGRQHPLHKELEYIFRKLAADQTHAPAFFLHELQNPRVGGTPLAEAPGVQGDPDEFLSKFLAWDAEVPLDLPAQRRLDDLFMVSERMSSKCENCQQPRSSVETTTTLHLNAPSTPTSIAALINAVALEESTCSECNTTAVRTVCRSFEYADEVLKISLVRNAVPVEGDDGASYMEVKRGAVDIDPELKVTVDDRIYKYQISACVMKIGLRVDSGHYVCVAADPDDATNGPPIEYDDEQVKRYPSWRHLLTSTRYPVMLLYQRCGESEPVLEPARRPDSPLSSDRATVVSVLSEGAIRSYFRDLVRGRDNQTIDKAIEVLEQYDNPVSEQELATAVWYQEEDSKETLEDTNEALVRHEQQLCIQHSEKWLDWLTPTTWYSSDMMSGLLAKLRKWLRLAHSDVAVNTLVCDALLYTVTNSDRPQDYYKTSVFRSKDGLRAPFLGTDASWRRKMVVLPASVARDLHWAVHVIWNGIFFTFDSAGGQHDDVRIREGLLSVLEERVQQEIDRGLAVGDTVHDRWVVVPNDHISRTRIGWVQQQDGYSCGPLTMAAVQVIMHRSIPSYRKLSMEEDRLHHDNARALRFNITWMTFVLNLTLIPTTGLQPSELDYIDNLDAEEAHVFYVRVVTLIERTQRRII